MMKNLRALANCGRPWAEQRAQLAMQLNEEFQCGELGASEYKELVQDLIRTDELDQQADDLELKTLLVNSVYALSQVKL